MRQQKSFWKRLVLGSTGPLSGRQGAEMAFKRQAVRTTRKSESLERTPVLTVYMHNMPRYTCNMFAEPGRYSSLHLPKVLAGSGALNCNLPEPQVGSTQAITVCMLAIIDTTTVIYDAHLT